MSRWWSGRLRSLVTRAVLLASAAVLFAGCVRAEIAVRVEDDGSGTAAVLFSFKKSLLDLINSLDESGTANDFDPKGVFSDLDVSSLPEGTKIEPYDADGFVGSRITVPFGDVQELSELLNRITGGVTVPGEAASSSSDGGFERFAIERSDGGWRLDAVARALGSEEDTGTDDAFTQQFLQDASFSIKIRLPGNVLEHNADEAKGNELTWNLDLQSTQPRQLLAETSGPGSSSRLPWALIAGAVVGVVALGGIAWDVRRRRGTRRM